MEKKPELLATDVPRLRHQAVDLQLLTVDRIFRATNLVGAGRVRVALIDCRQLRLKPLACRIRRLCVGSGDSRQRNSGGKCRLAR